MTSLLRAGQLVYTRIETEFSPTGKSGFQTVYRSDDLSPEQIEQIERRVQCYQPFEPSTLRLQFFRLTTGEVVLTQSRIVEPWPEFKTVVDKIGRSGPFVAHCLVLTQQTLREAGGDLLALLQSELFTPNLPALLERYGNAASFRQNLGTPNGVIASLKFMAPPVSPAATTGWEGEEGRRLVALALQADALTREGKSIALIGKQDEITATLQAALALVPFDERLNCSFDTCVGRCSVAPGQYWAVGVKERIGGSNYVDVSATQRRVTGTVALPAATSDLYALWIDDVTRNQGSIDAAQGHARTVQLISRALSKSLPLPKEARNDEAGCVEFLRVHDGRVRTIIAETLTAAVGGERIAAMIAPEVDTRLANPLDLLDTACRRSLDGLGLASMLYNLILERGEQLRETEWKQVVQLAQREQHYGLLFLSATTRKLDQKLATDSVRYMPRKQYSELLTRYGSSLSPAFFVGGDNTATLVEYLKTTKPELTPGETYDLYEALLRSGSVALLNDLGSYITSLDAQGRRRVQKLFDKYPPPTDFQRRLEDAIAAEAPRGLIDRLFRRN